MARETKTVQCYPSDSAVNEKCKLYGSFGWELIGNQRCQEQQSYGEYINTSTFNKLTFSRERTAPWYGEVTALENKYNELYNTKPSCYTNDPSKGWLVWGIIIVVLAAVIALFFWGLGVLEYIFYLSVALGILGAVFITVFAVKKSHYNRDYSAYLSASRAWDDTTGKEIEELRRKAETLVNSYNANNYNNQYADNRYGNNQYNGQGNDNLYNNNQFNNQYGNQYGNNQNNGNQYNNANNGTYGNGNQYNNNYNPNNNGSQN